MNIEQLRYVCMVAKTKSITIAAENMFVTQQTISKAINKLEEELGTTLMIRSHKGVQLTETGTVFVEHANKIVRDFQHLYDITRTPDMSELSGKVQVYCTSYMSQILGHKLIVELLREHPKIQISLKEMLSAEVLELMKNEVDGIGIVPMVNDNSGVGRKEELSRWLDIEPLCRDSLVALVSEKSPLAKRESITLKELTKQPIAWGECFHMADILLEDYEVEANVMLRSNNVNLQQSTIKEDMAVSFATEMIVNGGSYNTAGMKILPIKDNLQLKTYMVKSKNHKWTKAELAAIDGIKKAIADI